MKLRAALRWGNVGVVVGVVSVVGGVVGVARKEGRMRGVRREISASMASVWELLVE